MIDDNNSKLKQTSDEEWKKAVQIINKLAAAKRAEHNPAHKQWEQMVKLHNDSYAKAVGYANAQEFQRSDFKPKPRVKIERKTGKIIVDE
jgi:hypothetical protein